MNNKLTLQEENTLDFYEKSAEVWTKSHAGVDFWRPEQVKFQELLPEGKVIGIGCGGGRDALFLNKQFKYIGIDISKAQVEQARKAVPDTDFRVMSMYDLDFLPKTFDGFWAVASFLHIPKNRIGDVLQELKKVLKPNAVGFIAIKEGNKERIIADELGGERFFAFYQQKEFTTILESNGFEVLESKRDFRKYNPPQNLTVWLLYFVKIK